MSSTNTGSPQDKNAEKYLRHTGDMEGMPTATDQANADKVISKTGQKNLNDQAHLAADKDIAGDADASIHSPNDDLDEGELARLGENFPV